MPLKLYPKWRIALSGCSAEKRKESGQAVCVFNHSRIGRRDVLEYYKPGETLSPVTSPADPPLQILESTRSYKPTGAHRFVDRFWTGRASSNPSVLLFSKGIGETPLPRLAFSDAQRLAAPSPAPPLFCEADFTGHQVRLPPPFKTLLLQSTARG
jgi:hypothetical protein